MTEPTLFLPGPGKRVLARCAALTRIPEAELTGFGRTRALTVPRYAIMLTMAELGWSSSWIGPLLGGREHTTVLHGIGRARALLASDGGFRALVEALRAAARDVSGFVRAPAVPEPLAVCVRPAAKPDRVDPEEVELRDRRRAMAIGSLLLARAIRDYRRLPA